MVDATRLNALAQKYSVQEPDKKQFGGDLAWFAGMTERKPYIDPPGYRSRDRQLRDWDRDDQNSKWRGCRAGIIKKEAAMPWSFNGKGTVVVWDGEFWREVDAVEHFQAVWQNAQFGAGYTAFIKLFMRAYYTQDFGVVCEVIGPGEPDQPITGAPVGIDVLDSLRCIANDDNEFPISYYSPTTGELHKMHKTRVMRFVDMPDNDERLKGSGECALSRYMSTAIREFLMTRYIEQRLDDKPKPGIAVASNLSDMQVQAALGKYNEDQYLDDMKAWGKTLWFYGIDPANPAKIETLAFAEAPEKFDYVAYTNHDVNELALAFNTDKNEIWELSGGTLGSGMQSEIMAQKARGKVIADFTSMMERAFNINVLPDTIQFEFTARDEEADRSQAEQDQALITIANAMHAMPDTFTPLEIRQMLADRSETFKEILTDEQGNVRAPDVNDVQEPEIGPVLPAPEAQQLAQPTGGTDVSPAAGSQPSQAVVTTKTYATTKAEFMNALTALVQDGLRDDVSRRRFGIMMRYQLRELGQRAYEDGLALGGVTGEITPEDTATILDWLGEQSAYVTSFADTVFQEGLTPTETAARAEMWANKSLDDIYQQGIRAADENGMYEWIIGQTLEHCETCARLHGQAHRFKEWYKRGLLPKSNRLACKGFQCSCQLVPTQRPAEGRF